MSSSSLTFNCAIVTGGGGGLGRAFSEHLIKSGKKVILAGRTESNLKTTAQEIGATAYYVLDTGKTSTIPEFIEKVTSEHPEVDCIINNAGVQRPLEIGKMDVGEFLEKADQEIDINVRGPMHLALGLLPHFKTKREGAVIMNVSSTLGFLPTSIINPVYNGTKAWVHMFSTNLRTQLQAAGDTKHIRVIEIAPPSVGTDLHREREDPDDNKGGAALSVEEFMGEVMEGWESGADLIGAGMSKQVISKWLNAYSEDYKKAADGYIGN